MAPLGVGEGNILDKYIIQTATQVHNFQPEACFSKICYLYVRL